MATDVFTNTNGTALNDHDAAWDLGPVGHESFTLARCNIQSNALALASGAWAGGYVYYNTSSTDDSQISTIANCTYGAGPAVRCSSTTGYAIAFTNADGGNWTRLSQYKNTSWSAYFGNASTWAQSSVWYLRLTASGTSTTTLTAYVGSSSSPSQYGSTVQDSSSPHTSGNCGIYLAYPSGNAVTMADNWTDGESEASSTPSIPKIMNYLRQMRGN